MFPENNGLHRHKGWIEVICGSMFSGKTEELIRRLRRAQFARQTIEIFKPEVDSRYNKERVVSHDENSIHSTVVGTSAQIPLLCSKCDVVGIDEAQFFDDGLADVCNSLANNGVRVIVAGLDMDYSGKPFGPIPRLMAIAEFVTKVHAICMNCGELANHSYRKTADTGQVLLGAMDNYEPICRQCFNKRTLR